MTLRKKLMLSFLILVLLMGSMIGYFSYQNAKNLVLENKEQEMADTINRIDISINSQVQQINRLAENVKSSQIVRAYLKKEIHTQEETEELNDWMEGLLNLISSCSDLILMNEDGTVYYSYSGYQAVMIKGGWKYMRMQQVTLLEMVPGRKKEVRFVRKMQKK